jgi:hypothetical protein
MTMSEKAVRNIVADALDMAEQERLALRALMQEMCAITSEGNGSVAAAGDWVILTLGEDGANGSSVAISPEEAIYFATEIIDAARAAADFHEECAKKNPYDIRKV